jgi:hypothetical protein
MSTNALLKIIIGVALVLAFIPTGYTQLAGLPMMILIIICVIAGIKLIMDGLNQL